MSLYLCREDIPEKKIILLLLLFYLSNFHFSNWINFCKHLLPKEVSKWTFVYTRMCISLASFHVQILCILLVSNLLFWYKTYVTFQYLQSLRDQTTLNNGKPHMALILLLRQAQVTYQFNFMHWRRNLCTLHRFWISKLFCSNVCMGIKPLGECHLGTKKSRFPGQRNKFFLTALHLTPTQPPTSLYPITIFLKNICRFQVLVRLKSQRLFYFQIKREQLTRKVTTSPFWVSFLKIKNNVKQEKTFEKLFLVYYTAKFLFWNNKQ